MKHRMERHLVSAAAVADTQRLVRHSGGAAPHPKPAKPEEMSWRDYLIMLLHIAAEIEHGLMVEYLYAAYSLGGPQVPQEHRAMIERWRNSILAVAKEEMGHLL